MNLLKGVFLAFIAFQFLSCNTEPLTGEFVEEEQNTAEEGQFRALIEGEDYIATSVSATLSEDNRLMITGAKSGGESISLFASNAGVGSFDLSYTYSNNNIAKYYDGSSNLQPYTSADSLAGYGLLNIDVLDLTAQTVTGTFSFVGMRAKLDGDGNPILDNNGDPVLEQVSVTSGAFNEIPFELDETGTGGGDGNGNTNPNNEFFAKVDGFDFIADSLRVYEPMVGDVHMINIEAKNGAGESLRIDIPRSLGVGTHNMVQISDGTNLIALYNDGMGGENLTSNPGTITITEFDLEEGILEATFSFTGTDPLNQSQDTVEVTDGSLVIYFEGVPGATNYFRANVDSAAYEPTDIVVSTDVFNQYPTITITTMLDDQEMVLTFPATITEGSHEMTTEVVEGNEIVGSYTPIFGTSISYVSNPGTLIITSYDFDSGIIEGTFNFTAVDATGQDPTVYQISSGEFLAVLP